MDKKKIKKVFNVNELYVFIYTLECIKEYINKDKNIEKEFLNNFINVQNIDEILYNILMNFDTKPNNCQLIHYECLIILVDIIKIIEAYKEDMKEDDRKIMKKIDKNEIFKYKHNPEQ